MRLKAAPPLIEQRNGQTNETSFENTSAHVEINEINFPDSFFLSWVKAKFNERTTVPQTEFDKVTSLKIIDQNITNLKGVEFFSNLTVLDVSTLPKLEALADYAYSLPHSLSSLTISGLPALQYINVSNTNLTQLDLTGLSALEFLFANSTNLATLDLSSCSRLKEVSVNNAMLTSLKVSGLPYLTDLSCRSNLLTELNVAGTSSLVRLDCSKNQLTKLTLTGLNRLQVLSCASNRLTSLTLTDLSQLTHLSCDNNQLASLTLTNLSQLTYLSCDNNQLTSLTLTGLDRLQQLFCSFNQLTGLNLTGLSRLELLYCYENQLSSLSVAGLNRLKTLACFSNYFSDITKIEGFNSSITSAFSFYPQNKPEVISGVKSFVMRLYAEGLGRQPGSTELSQWVYELENDIQTGASASEGFLLSDEFNKKMYDDKKYVETLYRVCLGRSADGGMQTWMRMLAEGCSRRTVLNQFMQTDEFKKLCATYGITPGALSITNPAEKNPNVTMFIYRLYTQVLGRKPDAKGISEWAGRILSEGHTPVSVADGFLSSPEFIKKNYTHKQFAETLYRVFLERNADAGISTWLNMLSGGCTRRSVTNLFGQSAEFKELCIGYGMQPGVLTNLEPREKNVDVTMFVNRLYKEALGRDADAGGANTWTSAILDKQKTPISVAEGFIFSAEFAGKNYDNTKYVERLYRTFMGRSPDIAGNAMWTSSLNTGGKTRQQVFSGFAQSDEFGKIMASFGL